MKRMRMKMRMRMRRKKRRRMMMMMAVMAKAVTTLHFNSRDWMLLTHPMEPTSYAANDVHQPTMQLMLSTSQHPYAAN
eukprot:6464906-Lingulodinium_polyedra.AAC.1